MLKKALIVWILIFIGHFVYGQNDSVRHFRQAPFNQINQSFGLIPELYLFPEQSLGLHFALANSTIGEGSFSTFGLSGGLNYRYKLLSPELGFWSSGTAFIFGYYAGASIRLDGFSLKRSMSLIPKLGLSFYHLSLYYSYNFRFNANVLNDNPAVHNLTLSYYIKLFEK
jgi:hypothetical protein